MNPRKVVGLGRAPTEKYSNHRLTRHQIAYSQKVPQKMPLHKDDCTPGHSSIYITKFANDTTVVRLNSYEDEPAHR